MTTLTIPIAMKVGSTAGVAPSNLMAGEPALHSLDGILYSSDGAIVFQVAPSWAQFSAVKSVVPSGPLSVGWWQMERALSAAGWLGYLTAVMPAAETAIGQVYARNLPVTPGDTFTAWMAGVLQAALGWSASTTISNIAALFATASAVTLGAPSYDVMTIDNTPVSIDGVPVYLGM